MFIHMDTYVLCHFVNWWMVACKEYYIKNELIN